MTSETVHLTYDEYDALLQEGYDSFHPYEGQEAPGQWAAGVYYRADGTTVTVLPDRAWVFDGRAYRERMQRERREERERLLADPDTPREFEAVFQVFATVRYVDGKATEVVVSRELDGDFLSDVVVEGVGQIGGDDSDWYDSDNEYHGFNPPPKALDNAKALQAVSEWPEEHEDFLALWRF